jgi:hypothetical protein
MEMRLIGRPDGEAEMRLRSRLTTTGAEPAPSTRAENSVSTLELTMNNFTEDDSVILLTETLRCPAWRAMSHGARQLYVLLKARYSGRERNNGKIILPIRTAAQELGSGNEEVVRWFRELQHYGFIVRQGDSRSPHWRLTELGYAKERPTRDFMHWDGTPFVRRTRASRHQAAARPGIERGVSMVAH